MTFKRFGVVLTLVLLIFSSASQSRGAGGPAAAQPVKVVMKNVNYHYSGPIAVHIIQLQGYLTPAKPGSLVVFDDYNSFVMHLASAEIAISCDALARVLNENVFSAANAPIKAITITNKNNQLDIKGKLHQKGDVSFEAAGTLSVDADGRIRLHTEKVKAAHLPVKGILDVLGIDLAKLINTNQVRGIAMEKNDMLLNPAEILPPPRIEGKVTAVRLVGSDIVQIFGTPQGTNFAAKQTGNFMAYRGGELRFGKLTMSDADLVLTDMDPSDPLDFYLDHYKDQLVAGYTKITPAFGLRVYVRDFNRLHAAPNRVARNSSSGK
ncbi:MAG TPA: hypothetical protein VGG14_06110 [Candidatus Sulfotelmatobacter sp.]|jgi:hypothetical protein